MPEIKRMEQLCLAGIFQLEEVLRPAFMLAAHVAGTSILSLAKQRSAAFRGIREGEKVNNDGIGKN